MFRLKAPFALLPDALCHGASNMCAIMPEHIASTDPFKAFTEVIGSGCRSSSWRNERVPGSFFAYQKFDKYKPREDGEASFVSGPKIVHFDRVEWHVQPDPATKSAALQAGEMDWWENPTADLLPLLKQNGVTVEVTDHTGTPYLQSAEPNCIRRSTVKPAVRRGVDGGDRPEDEHADRGDWARDIASLWQVPMGFFPPLSPLASDVGMDALTSKRDDAKVKKDLEAYAGYNGGEDRVHRGHRSAGAEGAERRRGGHDEACRPERGLPGDRLGNGGAAARAGPSLRRRAAWNMFCTGFYRVGLVHAGEPTESRCAATARMRGSGWPDDPEDGGTARRVVQRHPMCRRRRKVGIRRCRAEAFEDVPFYPRLD